MVVGSRVELAPFDGHQCILPPRNGPVSILLAGAAVDAGLHWLLLWHLAFLATTIGQLLGLVSGSPFSESPADDAHPLQYFRRQSLKRYVLHAVRSTEGAFWLSGQGWS